MKHTLPLKKNRDFGLVHKKGKSCADKLIVVIVYENGCNYNRLGISAGKKVGHAVLRNRVRRRLKEAYRHLEQHILPGHDIVILPRPDSTNADFASLKSRLQRLLHKQGIFCPTEN